MTDALAPGLKYELTYPVPEDKIVAALYPEATEFAEMPRVFATGFLVGLLEWTCIQAVRPHLDWPREQTIGTHIAVSHVAPTPPGLSVTARVRLTEVEGRRPAYNADTIGQGTHERHIIDAERFAKRVQAKSNP